MLQKIRSLLSGESYAVDFSATMQNKHHGVILRVKPILGEPYITTGTVVTRLPLEQWAKENGFDIIRAGTLVTKARAGDETFLHLF